MKKWSGGSLIVILAIILVVRYSFMEKETQKQFGYNLFGNQTINEFHLKDNSTIKSSRPQQKLKLLKNPYLTVVEGLHDLYSVKSASEELSKVKLVWAQMYSILSRPDSLLETAQGIKEASIAWKELLATIEMENASKSSDSSHNENNAGVENCPFSVTASILNQTISGNGTILYFPCGFIEGSSITVVGVPDGHNESFQIELTGSPSPGEPKPPIILQYNVILPRDTLKEEPVIIQNTWTAVNGWGEEKRCPALGSTGNLKVDRLVCCNQQAVRTFAEEKHNKSLPSAVSFKGHNQQAVRTVSEEKLNKSLPSDVFFKGQTGSSRITSNFPFSEGNPFTATLWVGQEGFHMTVNGRHETSFAYREKLEPWLVTEAKVTGGLDIFSALANGLPVSEDVDLFVDAEHLKAPPLSRKRLIMFIGVFSTGNNFERRMALRRSWMQYGVVRSGDVAVRFFIGLHKNRQVNIELWKEAHAYGDIQLMPFVDYYSLITLKTISICIMGTKILPAKYIMKTDDDAFVRIDEVLSALKGKVSKGLLYGLISFESSPHRDRDSKWYISIEEWPHTSYPPWAHGPGYIISRDIAKFIVQGHQERNLKLFKLEDVAMGIWIEQFKKSGREVQYINDDRFYNAGCESNYVLAHYQGPRKVLCLWEKLQKDHVPLCCE